MAKSRYKQYVGTDIGGYLILEELGTVGNTPQARYSNRRFRVLDIKTGFEMVMRMGALRRNHGYKDRSSYRNFRDLTGQIVGNWEVLNLANDGPVKKGDRSGSLWNVRNVLTGEETILPHSKMKIKRRQHDRRTAEWTHPLYNVWLSLRSATGTKTDSRYQNYGALGYTIDRKRWNNFTNFKNDILSTVGDRPKSDACLFPIEGKHFCYNNVEWRYRKQRNRPATYPGNLRPKDSE